MEMREISTNRYLFRFNHPIDRTRTMERSPWNFDRNILILNEMELEDNPQDINLNWCAFFIQVQGLPLRQMTAEVARYIWDRLGKFIEVDQGGQGWGSTMRIRVLLDVRQPLKRIMRLRSSTGETQQIWLLYERLPNFCYICGVLGHIAKSCPKQYEEGYIDPGENTQYGSWMRAPTPRPSFRGTIGISNGAMEGSGRGYGGPSMRGAAIFDPSPTLTPMMRSVGETCGIENQSVPRLTEKHNNTHTGMQHGVSGNVPTNEELRRGLTTTQPEHNSQLNKLTPQSSHQSTQLNSPIQPIPNSHPLQPSPHTLNPHQSHPIQLNPHWLKEPHLGPLMTNPSPEPTPPIPNNDSTILSHTSPNPILLSSPEIPHVNHIT
ncbi:UNVERIFIED_CONTAM: hypothetical protein Sradi_1882300 [Sesamum radiatum]|uniref:CCHC-type domain-containing protein n=1 Tax=Sesamum radiatum TaxID=300843 RepID=A0AAW2TXN5_SESRA